MYKQMCTQTWSHFKYLPTLSSECQWQILRLLTFSSAICCSLDSSWHFSGVSHFGSTTLYKVKHNVHINVRPKKLANSSFHKRLFGILLTWYFWIVIGKTLTFALYLSYHSWNFDQKRTLVHQMNLWFQSSANNSWMVATGRATTQLVETGGVGLAPCSS